MALADVVYEAQEPCFKPLNAETMDEYIRERINILEDKSKVHLINEGFSEECVHTEIFLNIRYQGTDTSIMCKAQSLRHAENTSYLDYENSFLERYA
jgi:5-oxoprolinase (ATP-hydrolysing)